MQWFDVDKEGLARLLERRGKPFAILELVQNAWDEATTTVDIVLQPDGRGKATLVVTDDNPEGFKFIEHAYTLFAESTKIDDPEKRGRFNLGEKLFLAVCDRAEISTVKGTVTFDTEGRHFSKKGRPAGTCITATVRLNRAEQEEVGRLVKTLLPPAGIKTVFNGEVIDRRDPARVFRATLATEKADFERILRPTRRQTNVEIYEPWGDEKPHIYEMGIPVVEHDGKFHVNVMQKVPLNSERNNVTPSYLTHLREAVLDNTFDMISGDDAHKAWVTDALPKASDEALQKIITERFGEKVVINDPSCPEANLRAQEAGFTVIYGRQIPSEIFSRVKNLGLAKPSGQHTELRRDIQFSGGDEDYSIDPEKWTEGMWLVARYTKALAQELLGRSIEVNVYNFPFGMETNRCGAFYGGGEIGFNLRTLGHAWFNAPDQEAVDRLLIHEFSHAKAENHLSDAFYNECCRLGAKLRHCKAKLT